MLIIRKMPIWLTIMIGVLVIGSGAFANWISRLHWLEIPPPPEVCWSDKFPGKSVAIDELDSTSRSVFDDKVYWSEINDGFYSSFQEERVEKVKFVDGKASSELALADEFYRFFWLRTFHNPVVIRVFRVGNEKFLVVKQTDGQSEYQPGKLIVNNMRMLSDLEWCEFIRLLDSADFWNKQKIETNQLAHDGSFWEIEGVRENNYYIAGEQSPPGGEFYDACKFLMRLAGLRVNPDDPAFY